MKRTVQLLVLLLPLVMLLSFARIGTAADVAALEKQMPRSFSGQYQWRNSTGVEKVSITFSDIRPIAGGALEATGTGEYDVSGQITRIRVRAVINADTLAIELWESAPTSENFTTDGSHRGRLSPDLRTINAVWTTRTTQRQGDLRLMAVGNQ